MHALMTDASSSRLTGALTAALGVRLASTEHDRISHDSKADRAKERPGSARFCGSYVKIIKTIVSCNIQQTGSPRGKPVYSQRQLK